MPVLKVYGAHEAAASFLALPAVVNAGLAAVVAHHGQVYQARVRARASGRPGPRAITGDYRRSIGLELGSYGGAVAAFVGTNAPQGRRLEMGFTGVDSLGRHYNQPPFAHWEPDLMKTADELEKGVEALLRAGAA